MKIRFHKNFEREYGRLKLREKERAQKRLLLFFEDSFDPRLRNHPLRGKYTNYRSINISGDLRAIYKQISDNECIFVAIGSHSQLYS